MNDLKKQTYNKFENSTDFGYKIIENLMLNNEIIWKLLKHIDADALAKDDLTLQEKAELIYDGQNPQENFRVFRQIFTEDASTEVMSQLRVQIQSMYPNNKTWGTITFIIQVVSHNKILTLSNYQNRLEVLQQQIIETLNGADISGLGRLYFNADETRDNNSRLNLFNNRNYLGYSIVMSTKTA